MVGGYFLKVINILRLSEVYLDSAFQFRGHFRITCRTFLHFTIPSPPSPGMLFFFFFLVYLFLAVSGLSYPTACGILVPCPGIEPTSPTHWKTDY